MRTRNGDPWPPINGFLALLQSDETLMETLGGRFFEGIAPDVAPDDPNGEPPAYPLLTYQIPHATNTLAAGGKVTLTFPDLLIKITGEGGGYADLLPAYQALCALLESPEPEEITVGSTSFVILGAIRNYPIQKLEVSNGIRYNVLGGNWQVYVQIG